MLKRIWQWFKNVISKASAFFGFKASTKSNTNKLNSNIIRNQENEVASEKIKDNLQNIFDNISFEDIKKSKSLLSSVREKGWYTDDGIFSSLPDIYINSLFDETKPVILVQNTTSKFSLSEEFTRVSQLCDKRNILYIRLRPTDTPSKDSKHWVIFYFFQSNNQKKILFINSLFNDSKDLEAHHEFIQALLEPFLEKEKFSLHISTTKIQQDGYSCGLIASEVIRMIYLNHAKFKAVNSKFVDLGGFLPTYELDQLIVSCQTGSSINYGKNPNAIDVRIAHSLTAYKNSSISRFLDLDSFSALWQTALFEILTNEEVDSNKFRKQVEENSELVKRFNLIEESETLIKDTEDIRARLIGSENKTNVEDSSQVIEKLYQAYTENINSNKTQETVKCNLRSC